MSPEGSRCARRLNFSLLQDGSCRCSHKLRSCWPRSVLHKSPSKSCPTLFPAIPNCGNDSAACRGRDRLHPSRRPRWVRRFRKDPSVCRQREAWPPQWTPIIPACKSTPSSMRAITHRPDFSNPIRMTSAVSSANGSSRASAGVNQRTSSASSAACASPPTWRQRKSTSTK